MSTVARPLGCTMSSGSDGVSSRAREIVIHRLNTGWIASPRAVGIFAEGRDPSRPGGFVPVPSMVPAPAWYIAGAGPRILVDIGTGPADALQAAQGRYGLKLETPRIVPASLRSEGAHGWSLARALRGVRRDAPGTCRDRGRRGVQLRQPRGRLATRASH